MTIITVIIGDVVAATDGNKWTSDDKMLQTLLNMTLKMDSKYLYYPSKASRAVDLARAKFPTLIVDIVEPAPKHDSALTY